MGRQPKIPERGDIPSALVARRLGLSADDFARCLPELQSRGFPEPDATTGLYAIEAVDRWRLRRYPRLFAELAAPATAIDAGVVFHARMRRIDG